MAGFLETFAHPAESALASATPDPLRDLERQSLARIRYLACYHSMGLDKHLETTAELSLLIAEELDLPPLEKENIWYAGSLHDIGKISIHPRILQKEDRLTEEEYIEIQNHTIFGHQILSGLGRELYAICAEVALSHHERWDGEGYPNKIRGEEISLATRIVSIADVYDCITAGRPYRSCEPKEEALQELQNCAGSQFDPHLVEIFVEKMSRS
ncbi:MAG: HD-GYP domain-containing protein [Puniceicoccales bacterium]